MPDELREALAAADGPVLLVDDQIDSGWTMTVAAALLRDAGAPGVLPLALAATTGYWPLLQMILEQYTSGVYQLSPSSFVTG